MPDVTSHYQQSWECHRCAGRSWYGEMKAPFQFTDWETQILMTQMCSGCGAEIGLKIALGKVVEAIQLFRPDSIREQLYRTPSFYLSEEEVELLRKENLSCATSTILTETEPPLSTGDLVLSPTLPSTLQYSLSRMSFPPFLNRFRFRKSDRDGNVPPAETSSPQPS